MRHCCFMTMHESLIYATATAMYIQLKSTIPTEMVTDLDLLPSQKNMHILNECHLPSEIS